MEIIKWETEKPGGQNSPAATGSFLNKLVEVQVYWQNVKGYFDVTFAGRAFKILPEHFDTLEAAKDYAEKEACSWLLASTEEKSPDPKDRLV